MNFSGFTPVDLARTALALDADACRHGGAERAEAFRAAAEYLLSAVHFWRESYTPEMAEDIELFFGEVNGRTVLKRAAIEDFRKVIGPLPPTLPESPGTLNDRLSLIEEEGAEGGWLLHNPRAASDALRRWLRANSKLRLSDRETLWRKAHALYPKAGMFRKVMKRAKENYDGERYSGPRRVWWWFRVGSATQFLDALKAQAAQKERERRAAQRETRDKEAAEERAQARKAAGFRPLVTKKSAGSRK